MKVVSVKLASEIQTQVKNIFLIGTVIFSWFLCYLSIIGMTEGWGAPWDIAPVRPPLGHWQRTINDFFESGTGAYLPTAIFLLASVCIYIFMLIRIQSLHTVSVIVSFSNIAALTAMLVIGLLFQSLFIDIPAHLTTSDWLYYGDFQREWPLSLMALLIFTALLWFQLFMAKILERKVN